MANIDDQNPDDPTDFEADNDFSEFESPENGQDIGSTLRNNPLVKLGLVAAGLIIVIGGIMLFGGDEAKTPTSAVGGSNNLKETPGTAELNPAMQEAMEEYNDQRIEQAVNQGSSVIPVPIEPPKTFLPVPSDASNAEDPLQRWREMQEERLKVQRQQEQLQAQQTQAQQSDPAAEQAKTNLAQAMATQMTQILARPAPDVSFLQVTSLETLKNDADKALNALNASNGAIPSGMRMGADGKLIPLEPLEIVIPAGSIVYAQLLNEANSDVEGPIVALIAQGPFSGSRALGTFQKKEELLVLQFTTLISKEGYSVPITAFAMDPDTTLTGMATDVDHRYFKRIILPAAAEFITGMGEAIAEKGTTTVTVNSSLGGSTSTTDNSNIDTEQEVSKGIEKAFDKVGDILDDEGNATEILVVVKAGTPLGILFMEPVTKQAIETARFGSGAVGGSNQQQQQGNPFFNMMGANQNDQYRGQQYPGQYQSSYPTQYNNTGAQNSLSQSIIQGLQNQQTIQSGTQ